MAALDSMFCCHNAAKSASSQLLPFCCRNFSLLPGVRSSFGLVFASNSFLPGFDAREWVFSGHLLNPWALSTLIDPTPAHCRFVPSHNLQFGRRIPVSPAVLGSACPGPTQDGVFGYADLLEIFGVPCLSISRCSRFTAALLSCTCCSRQVSHTCPYTGVMENHHLVLLKRLPMEFVFLLLLYWISGNILW